MNHTHLLSSSLAAALLLSAAPAHAQTLNVSRLVLGVPSNQPLPPTTGTAVACQSCTYATVYAAGMRDSYIAQVGPLQANGWPPLHGSTLAAPSAAIDNLGIDVVPSGKLADGGIVGAEQRTRAQLDKSPYIANPVREVAVQTWRSGSGFAAASYSVSITTPAATSGTVPTFVTLKIPRHRRGIQNAYTVASSGMYYYDRPQRMQAGSAVDVYVDGLPVWSGSTQVLVPGRYQPTLPTHQLHLRWGEALSATTEPAVTLFLGYLPSGTTRYLNMVVRSESHLDADGCKSDTSDQGLQFWRCHSQVESLTLPALWNLTSSAGMRPAISVFTR